MKIRPIIVIGALAAVVIGVIGYNAFTDPKSVKTNGILAPIKADNRIMADGTLQPLQSAVLSLATGGTVKDLPGLEGGKVEKGQLLLKVMDSRQRAAVSGAQAALRKAEARVKELQAGPRKEDVKAGEAALDAAQARMDMVERGGDSLQIKEAAAQLTKVKAELAAGKAGISDTAMELAKADLAAAKAALVQAEAALAETELRAPFNGTVGAVYAKVGEMVAPGVPLIRMGNMTKWLVKTDNLTELSIAKIAEGAKVSLSFDALPGLKLPGTVKHITSVGEDRQGDVTYDVTIEPLRTDSRLRWGMTAQVAIDPSKASK